MENLDKLVLELCKLPQETEWVEFKQNNCDPEMIGRDISALANSAVISDRGQAYMVWGVHDKNHQILGTDVRLKEMKRGNQELENWLRFLLSKNADFAFQSVEIDGNSIEIIIINKAVGVPVTFEKVDYVRIGTYTKKLIEFPTVQAQLWDKLRNEQFEETYAMIDLQLEDVPRLLNCDSYFELLSLPIPQTKETYVHYLLEEGIIVQLDNGLFAITNLGAILFAKKLSHFTRLGRKAIRIVKYTGINRLSIEKEDTMEEGYAVSLENAVKLITNLLPTKEDINSIRRRSNCVFPIPAIRESVANAVIHQDFFITGAGPVIELFDNRIEITNPGVPLVDIRRIVDNPPKSRNEKLASIMRRLNLCEELGRGWDRMVISCEMEFLPAPRISIYHESTKVSLFSHIEFSNLSIEDKLWSTYLHACIKYTEGDALTNSSLRTRFGLKESSISSISRLIKDSIQRHLIKPLDPTTAPRYMKYIPVWA